MVIDRFNSSLGTSKKLKDVQGARAKLADVSRYQLIAALYVNWLIPQIKMKDARILEAVEEEFNTGTQLRDELSRLGDSRDNAQLGSHVSCLGMAENPGALGRNHGYFH